MHATPFKFMDFICKKKLYSEILIGIFLIPHFILILNVPRFWSIATLFHLFSTILHGSALGWLGSALLASSRGAARQCSAVRSSALWSHSLLIAQSYFLSQTKKKNWGKNRLGVVFGAQRKKSEKFATY